MTGCLVFEESAANTQRKVLLFQIHLSFPDHGLYFLLSKYPFGFSLKYILPYSELYTVYGDRYLNLALFNIVWALFCAQGNIFTLWGKIKQYERIWSQMRP